MRHNKKFNHLGRTSSHRKALLSNMASSLILHKRISTTIAKAKALKMYLEPLVTKAKEDTTHSRRIVFSYLENKEAVAELFRDVVVKIGDRPGGYTRILRTETRLGDNADMCIIEFVDYNEAMLDAKDSKKKTSRRSRGKVKSTTTTTTTTTETVKVGKAPKKVAVAQTETASEKLVENVVEEAPEAIDITKEKESEEKATDNKG